MPPGRAARPESCVLSRARSLRLRTLPASLSRNDHRTPTASDVPPISPRLARVIDPTERWPRGHEEKPDYAGLLTYGGCRYTQDPAELAGVDVAVVGAPTDDLVSDRPGTRFGPRAIRSASCPPGPHLEAKVDAFDELTVVDFGDAPVIPADPARTHAAIEALVGQVLAAGAIPLVLGGDHSISEPDIRAVRERARPGRPRPLRHPHRHRHRGLRRRDLPRHAVLPARRAGPRRPAPLRPDRPARLLAGRGRVRLAGRARDHELLHARRPRARDRGGRKAGRRDRRRRARVPHDRRGRPRPGLCPRHRHPGARRDDDRRPPLGRAHARDGAGAWSAPTSSR